jgi:methanogenic corrinoid protein MtbC1
VPDEQHDLGLIAFGLALRARGWRIAYLGPDTPLDTLADAAASLGPELVVVTAVSGDRVDAAAEGLRALGARHQVAFGGSGGRPEQLSALGLIELAGDPVAAAERATELVQAPPPAAA